ncbi:YhbY family RNA-binding protein [Aquabacterium sp.]|uniref:YhbY family RNA-binding protein n=1 Tax=Aquabacterium sp. TaxID=1872578 RepID=UPI0035ADAD68
MPAITLTPAQRKAHRADAHHLNPVVLIGSDGLTPAVVKETDAALKAHGLIKVRVFSDDRDARETILVTLCDTLGAAPIQHIGKLLILWRPVSAKAKDAGESRNPGPRVVTVVKASRSGTRRPTVSKVKIMGNQRVTAGGSIKRVKKRATSFKKQSQG